MAQDDLNSFLAVAEDLKIKGLTQGEADGQPPPPAQSAKRAEARAPPAPPASLAASQEEEDIQEVPPVPVKTEPLATAGVVAETDDGSYAEYEEYEGYDDDPAYDDNGLLLAPGCDGNKGEETQLNMREGW